MNLTRDRVHSIGWAVALGVCLVLLAGLTLRVNAVKSQVRLTERQILAVQRQKLAMETEFQTRANQQQLIALNAVEFGFSAPTARQYVEGERQLAAFARPAMPAGPAPVLLARADAAPAPATAPVAAPVKVDLAPANVVRVASAAPRAGSLPALLAPIAGARLTAAADTRLLRGADGAAHGAARVALSDIASAPPGIARPVPSRAVFRTPVAAGVGKPAGRVTVAEAFAAYEPVPARHGKAAGQ